MVDKLQQLNTSKPSVTHEPDGLKTAHLIGAGRGAEAAAVDVDELVVRPLVGGDGAHGGRGAGGGEEHKVLLLAGVALRRGHALGGGSGDAART